ncbi:RidA family protein [Amycolatopsis sp., V23-08]|uniref:RidA family protein n=1 Tax=Amycolatopsis heterodermiae TaxID=3110235 RepID=A0ABU5R3P4_9PSEU|nr:RidA family protein [Amycolatopsis sp., V23-08]MEA5360325.1 RidA family protein [Amycolatopsis sp., V23-08]
MLSQTFSLPDAPPPAAGYSPVVRRGPLLAISGQVPFLPGRLEGPVPGFREQARTVFGYLVQLLETAGAGVPDVLVVRIYLAREQDFPVMNEVFDEVFGEVRPARTTVWVDLPGGLLIEADVLAVPGS